MLVLLKDAGIIAKRNKSFCHSKNMFNAAINDGYRWAEKDNLGHVPNSSLEWIPAKAGIRGV